MELNLGSVLGGSSSYGYSGSTGTMRTARRAQINSISRDIAEGYSADIDVINKYLQMGKVSKAASKYDNLLDEVRQTANTYGYQLSDSQIESILSKAYGTNFGTSLTNAAMEDCRSPFVTGLLQGIPIVGFFCESYSDAEVLAKTTGGQTSMMDKVKEGVGAALAGVAAGFLCGGNPIVTFGLGAWGVAQMLIKDAAAE